MRIFLIFLSLSNGLVAYSQIDEQVANQEFKVKGYQINYPKSWRLDSSRMMNTEVIMFSPLVDKADKFSENVNVIIQNLAGQKIDLERYKQITDSQLSNIPSISKVIESKIISLKEKSFFKVDYEMAQNELHLNISSICFIDNEKTYLVTLTTEVSTTERYRKIGDEISRSFTLKN